MFATQQEKIAAYKSTIQDPKYRAIALAKIVKERLDTLNKNDVIDTRNLLHTLDLALKYPDIVGIDLLTAYMTKLIRVMMNLGAGLDFANYLDKAIDNFYKIGLSPLDLLLAKGSYLGLVGVENKERKLAIDQAIELAKEPEGRIKCYISLAHYYNDSSQYNLSIELCNQCQMMVIDHQELQKYQAEIFVTLGMNYFYLFDYKQAKFYFQRVLALKIPDNPISNSIYFGVFGLNENETALHYLGRINAATGNLNKALEYYVDSLKLNHEYDLPRLGGIAFNHIRIGELLTSVGLLRQARDHLNEAQNFFASVHNSSSAQVQLDLAFAEIYIRERNFAKALKAINKAIIFSKSKGYPRGELFGYEKLFWLRVSRFQLHKATYTLIKALKTFQEGEIKRQGGFQIVVFYLRKTPRKLFNMFQGKTYDIFVAPDANQKPEMCICPIHKNKVM